MIKLLQRWTSANRLRDMRSTKRLEMDINRIVTFDMQHSHPPEPEWYGMAPIVRDVLRLPPDIGLNINIQHGIHFNEQIACEFYRNGTGPIFVSRQVYKDQYEAAFGRKAYVFGTAQIWYRQKKKVRKKQYANGTLAFPAHSSHHVHSFFDIEEYAEFLSSLPEIFQPVSVCLYWKDLLMKRHIPYLRRGLPVYTAGHLFDTQFIPKFYEILSHFKYTTGNDIGSHTIYSLEMGIPYFRTDRKIEYREVVLGDPSAGETHEGPIMRKLISLLPDQTGIPYISEELRSLVEYLHGCSSNINIEELSTAIHEAKKIN